LLSKLRSRSSVVTKSCVVHEYPDLNPWLRLVNILRFSKCLSMCLQITCSSILQDTLVKDTVL
jgi:hypothetical protein